MEKIISVKEGNTPRTFTEKKLETPLQGGGNTLWVPKDGTTLKTKRVNEPGVYKAKDDEAYGYSTFTTYGMVEKSKTELIKKSVTENGTYKAESDRAYGYNKVVVNVPGGGDYKDEDGLDRTSPPSYDPGSSVAGNGADGTPITVAVDDEGNLVRLGLADHILLDTPPDKMEYRDGERIIMAGAVVRGYLANGTPYKNASYQDSILPFYQGEEQTETEQTGEWLPGGVVIVSPLYAEYEASEGGKTSDLDTNWEQPIQTAKSASIYLKYYRSGMGYFSAYTTWTAIGDTELLVVRNSDRYVAINGVAPSDYDGVMVRARSVSTTFDGSETITESDVITSSDQNLRRYTYNGKTVMYAGFTASYAAGTLVEEEYIPQVADKVGPDQNTYWTAIYGESKEGGKQTITLTWPREGDRRFLTTTFEITVTE